MRKQVRQLPINDPKMSLRAEAAQSRVCSSAAMNVVLKELQLCSYKRQVNNALTENYKETNSILFEVAE